MAGKHTLSARPTGALPKSVRAKSDVPPVAQREVSAPKPELPETSVVAVAIATEAAPVIEDNLTATVVEAPAPLTAQKENHMDTETQMDTTAKAQAMFGDMNERAKAAMSKSSTIVAELNEFAKGNVEAIVESSKIAATGVQKLGQEAAEYSRRSFETATTAFKGMAQVKSPTELAKLHSDYVRSAFDMMVAEASKSTEAMLKLAGEVAQPISNRIAVAAEKVKIAA
jgi:hypothetical protein